MPYHELRVHSAELEDVLRQAYDMAIFAGDRLPHRSAAGRRAPQWALDMRLPLSRSELLRPIATEMIKDLSQVGAVQVAGYGYGAYALTAAIVALAPGFTGALIRDSAKPYGFRKIVEGDIRPQERVIVIDDLLGTGRSALRAAAALRSEGFRPTGVFTVFRFSWTPGREALHQAGLGHRCLGTLRRGIVGRQSGQGGEGQSDGA
jgi:orotate phosphoribosyltransferase